MIVPRLSHCIRRFRKIPISPQTIQHFSRCAKYEDILGHNWLLRCSQSCLFTSQHLINQRKFCQLWKGSEHCYCSSTSKTPVTMKLESKEFHNIFTPELNFLIELFIKYNYELRVAGGAVRDLLSGKQPHDLDFATTATPDQMKEMFDKENVRMLNTRGEKHGTITVRLNDKQNFEVTTLRVDVVTDGRRAQVVFITDWHKDANRRDLTVNSMFLGFDGTVYDYFNGIEDLKKKRVAFVGDTPRRIQEDFLRILRYFRFYGCIAEKPDNHEESTLVAIRENCAGLTAVSGERLWMELKKILAGNFAGELMQKMVDVGVAPYIGIRDPDVEEFQRVWTQSGHLKLEPMTLVAAMMKDVNEMLYFHERMKLSAYERDLALFTVMHREDKPSENPLKPYQDIVIDARNKPADVRKWICQVLKYRCDLELLEKFNAWEAPHFPVNGYMLQQHGVSGGKRFGIVTQKLKTLWKESNFTLTQNELLEKLPDILRNMPSKTSR